MTLIDLHDHFSHYKRPINVIYTLGNFVVGISRAEFWRRRL